jgi:ergothioneine biosynthesis protein EgtB
MQDTDHKPDKASRQAILTRYRTVRATTQALASPLAIEDYGLQAMPDASPPKWHLAHTTWFFETFVLQAAVPQYTSFHPEYKRLFNSYYETVGTFWPRAERSLLSRPTVDEVYRYRAYVDEALLSWAEKASSADWAAVQDIVVLGLNHEQQHQELLLTDTLYNLSVNPLYPAYRADLAPPRRPAVPAKWLPFEGGLTEIGYDGRDFCFDNELPRHRQWLEPYCLQNRPVTNGEFAAFIEGGGYHTPTLWLSQGWHAVQQHAWQAPLYWMRREGGWHVYTLGGLVELDPGAPVAHVSYFEADAYARWAGRRLPREGEWEAAYREGSTEDANLAESGWFRPVGSGNDASGLTQMIGDVWEWTESAYHPYPGYRPAVGALGEYNGKFMSGQQVLRGGSCVTPRTHIRATYRNFFPPEARWQFSGIRLADDAHE